MIQFNNNNHLFAQLYESTYQHPIQIRVVSVVGKLNCDNIVSDFGL